MKREVVKTNTKMIYARSGERVIALKGDIDNAKGGHKFKTLIECYKWICYLDISCVEQIIMLKMTGWYSGSVHYPFHYWRPLLITARFRNMHTGSWSYCSACKRKKMNSFESECWLFCYSNCHPIWSKHLLLEFRLKPSIYKKKTRKKIDGNWLMRIDMAFLVFIPLVWFEFVLTRNTTDRDTKFGVSAS